MHIVVEVTDNSVRVLPATSPQCAPSALIEAALDWIDDPVGLWEERPVAVADLWRTLMATLVGQRCEPVVVVHPVGWPRHRVDRVLAAAAELRGGIVTDRLLRLPSGPGKAEAIRHSIGRQPDMVFGNSRWDVEMLRLARVPWAINPSEELASEARQAGWAMFRPRTQPR